MTPVGRVRGGQVGPGEVLADRVLKEARKIRWERTLLQETRLISGKHAAPKAKNGQG